MIGKRLPDWLRLWIQHALLGEIYPAIRAIAVEFSKDSILTMRWYLDRAPQDEDKENMDLVMTTIESNTSCSDQIKKVNLECVFSNAARRDLDILDGLVYARKE